MSVKFANTTAGVRAAAAVAAASAVAPITLPTPVQAPPKLKKKGGKPTKPKDPGFDISVNPQGYLRNCHFQFLLGGISISALNDRIRKGKVPEPDGHDGRPYWRCATVKAFLERP